MNEVQRPRARDAGLMLGTMEPGPLNAITDVPDVRVGHVTLIEGSGALRRGVGPVRTGVTAVLPHGGNLFREKVPAGIFVLNGFGKCFGQEQIEEFGAIESPVMMTGTMNVGIVADGVAEYMMSLNPDIAVTTSTANALVTECSDAYLNDMQGRHVRQQHVREAIGRASVGPVAEGTVGAGTGMSLYGFKGGIGTASRRLPAELGGYTVGAIVLGNFGRRDQLTIAGVPVGRALADWQPDDSMKDTGSCIVLLATDAPMLDRALRRLARRAALGLARTGSIAGNSSGDFIVAFSNALRLPHDSDELLVSLQHITESGRLIDALFQASVEATEEAVINALFRATTLDGWDGHIRHALPLDRTLELLGQAGVLRAS
ncbi:MAG TPA: P1 family peptidase [Nitrolancea sp.]|nr:P1 family peptidase [Nitrolancea sp.]